MCIVLLLCIQFMVAFLYSVFDFLTDNVTLTMCSFYRQNPLWFECFEPNVFCTVIGASQEMFYRFTCSFAHRTQLLLFWRLQRNRNTNNLQNQNQLNRTTQMIFVEYPKQPTTDISTQKHQQAIFRTKMMIFSFHFTFSEERREYFLFFMQSLICITLSTLNDLLRRRFLLTTASCFHLSIKCADNDSCMNQNFQNGFND